MRRRVLHVLSQLPLRTGSGVTLDALVRHAARAGWDQWVVAATSETDSHPEVGDLRPSRVRPLCFGRGELDFPVPGMSDVMPYESTRFGAMTASQLDAYRRSWRHHLAAVCAEVEPDLIHVHHLWIVASLIKDVAPAVPVVNHCHATGLRQLELCGHLAEEVRRGCRRNERFVVLHQGDAQRLARELGIDRSRIAVVGAGYREELFHARGRGQVAPGELVYVGKLSGAKGLPQLLDAIERLGDQARASGGRTPPVRLHVVGSGAGCEADALRQRMVGLRSTVQVHGPLEQPTLAGLFRRCATCVLPSFYEGLPLVLVEARACGCRLVATALPGVVRQLAGPLGDALTVLTPPRMVAVDSPLPADLPAFVDELTAALRGAVSSVPPSAADDLAASLEPFTWSAVFRRIATVWRELGDDVGQRPSLPR